VEKPSRLAWLLARTTGRAGVLQLALATMWLGLRLLRRRRRLRNMRGDLAPPSGLPRGEVAGVDDQVPVASVDFGGRDRGHD